MQVIYLLATGIAAGICSGIFGIGGGIILVPLLIFAFGYSQQMANGTSLVALLLPVGALGVMAYYRSGKINADNIKFGLLIAVGIFLGTYLGSQIAIAMPQKWLSRIFALFLVAIASRMWFLRS